VVAGLVCPAIRCAISIVPPEFMVFGDARCAETVTTNSFQDPACPRPFLDKFQDAPTIQASLFNRFTILAEGRKKWSTWI
jgi:hypothetical protein